MRSERIILFVSAIAILIVIGIFGFLNSESSSNTLENSKVQVPAGWEKISSPDKKIISYDYNRTFILNIESINRSTYYDTFINYYYAFVTNGDQVFQNNSSSIIDIEGVDVLYERNIVFDTTNDLKKVKNLIQQYMFQKEGKYYMVRFGFFPKNSTDSSIINSSSALFDETLKSIIITI